jgi:hypothetical protein|tara:strand:+ start:952 stop:1086 length:135 start_codon:yes stop_codon:yes gene_type:complete
MIKKYCGYLEIFFNEEVICGRVATHENISKSGKITPVCAIHNQE